MTTRPLLFGLLIVLGFAGVPTFAFDEDRTILGQDTTIFRDREGRELTGKLLALSENTAKFYKAREHVVLLDAGEPTVEPPAPPLPPNCSYLNLWSYYYRWTTAGLPISDVPFAPTMSGGSTIGTVRNILVCTTREYLLRHGRLWLGRRQPLDYPDRCRHGGGVRASTGRKNDSKRIVCERCRFVFGRRYRIFHEHDDLFRSQGQCQIGHCPISIVLGGV